MSEGLRLLSGSPISVNNLCYVHPVKIGDIRDIGEDIYNKYLSSVLIDKAIVSSELDISNYKFIVLSCLGSSEFARYFTDALGYFLRKTILINDNEYFYFIDDDEENIIINEVEFDEIIRIIKLQNCVVKHEDEEIDENPSNEKAREILEKRRKARDEVNRIKKNVSDGEPLTWDDLVSMLCANGNGINIFNVWDMSIYAFNNQFNRMKMLEEYDINIRSLLAGASKDDIDLKHWMSKI